MTDKSIHLKIIAHENTVLESDIRELYVQTTGGRMGIMADHIPVVCALDIGVAKTKSDTETRQISVMGGILKFSDNNAVILTDNAELDCNIDVARARHARQRAEARLKAKDDNIDTVRAQIALSKAIARINAHEAKYD